MNWIALEDLSTLDKIDQDSAEIAQVIFKHSTRCSISSMAKGRLDRSDKPESSDFYFLDLIANRALSSAVAERYGVTHESPQILIIKNGKCVYNESHNGITMADIADQL